MTTDLTPQVQTLALSAGWLNDKNPANDSGGTLTTNYCAAYQSGTAWYPNTWYYTWPQTYTPRPIRLGLSEVEKLRQAAKRDAKLKAILEKFTDQIEVVVDFK